MAGIRRQKAKIKTLIFTPDTEQVQDVALLELLEIYRELEVQEREMLLEFARFYGAGVASFSNTNSEYFFLLFGIRVTKKHLCDQAYPPTTREYQYMQCLFYDFP